MTRVRSSCVAVAAAIAVAVAVWLYPTVHAAAQSAPTVLPNLFVVPHTMSSTRIRAQKPSLAAVPQIGGAPRHATTVPAADVRTAASSSAQAPSCMPPNALDEIVELARALKWNPDLIYEYVRNNITTIPVYDSLKGGWGALIDGAGTPVDQAELMYDLLQQSCYSPQYEVGLINLPAEALTKWLGTDTSFWSVAQVLGENGFYQGAIVYTQDGTTNTPVVSADIPWVWVTAPIPNGGANYQFDPASKIFDFFDGYNPRSTGLGNLASALGYTQSTFLTDAENGATGIGTPVVSGINRGNVRGDLTTYADNLIGYIKAQTSAATTVDIIGGVTIAPLPPYTPPASGPTTWGQTTLCYVIVGGACSPNEQGVAPTPTSDLTQFRTTLTVTLGWNDSSGNFTQLANPVTYNSSDIYGHRLVISVDPNSSIPSLLLDGSTQVTATSAVPSEQQLTARIAITHPHLSCADLPIPASCTSSGMAGPPTDNVRVTPSAGAIYVIGTGWGGAGRGMIEKHRKLLLQNQAAGFAATSEPVLGESLAMIGDTWIAQCSREMDVVTELTGATTTWLHAVGIIGMKPVGNLVGPYVDLPLNTIDVVQRTGRTAAMTTVTPAESAAFFSDAGMLSIFESGTIEQTQPNSVSGQPSAVAASTVKLLDQWSQSGPILDINDWSVNVGGVTDNCAYYASTLRGQLTNYVFADLTRIDSLVGYSAATNSCSATPSTTRVIAPTNGSLSVGQWTGTGYLQILYSDPNQTVVSAVGAIITGGLSGGEPGSPVDPSQMSDNFGGALSGSLYFPPSVSASFDASVVSTNIAASPGGSSLLQASGADPADLVTGSVTYNHEDISVGSGNFPDRLSLVRYYDSGLDQAGRNSSLLGNGWIDNFDKTALPDSDGFQGMGESSPISGAVAIAALYVIQDILNEQTTTAKPTERVTIAAQAERWLMDQMTNNVVSVVQAGSIEQFVLLPNGGFNPSPGSATVLSASPGGGYTYQASNGITLTFGSPTATAAGKITQWTNATGAAVGFSYNSDGQLQSVCEPDCNSSQRQLNFHYTGTQLTSVDDNTGSAPRTVTYGFDSNGNLGSVTDPLGNQARFVYGGSFDVLSQIFYPSFPSTAYLTASYDSLGRVEQETDANGNMTNLFFAGTRAETDDPSGTAHVSYFNANGQTLATIEGLGSPTINGGAGDLTSYSLDGLGRVVTATNPEGDYLTYAYDANSFPTSVSLYPRPGWIDPHTGQPPPPLVTTNTYVSPVSSLPNFEEVQTATDPRGIVTTNSYDTHGNLIARVADSGAGHFNATRRYTYDSQGRVLTATDSVGSVTENTYDAAGDLIATIADYGPGCGGTQPGHLCLRTLTGYDLVGDAISTTDPNANTTTRAYDADRRLFSITLPPAPTILVTTNTYDPDGRVLQAQKAVGSVVVQTTSTTYTPMGKPATTTDANGNRTSYGYDVMDRVSRVADPAGRTTLFAYDPLGRLYQKINPAIQANPLEQYAYTPNGKQASVTDAKGNIVAFAYDGFGRLYTTTYPDSSIETLSYDNDGNLTSRETRAGATITFTYDNLNRVSSKSAPSEPTVTYTYDLAGRQLSVSDNSAAIPGIASGVSASYATSYTYDALNRLRNATWTNAPTAVALVTASATFTHGYNADNQRISQTASDNSWWYYPPPPASSIRYTANALNQYTAIGSVTLTYDGNGNLTSDGSLVYCYDAEGRLIGVVQGSCTAPTSTVASYSSDAQGRRKLKTVGTTTTVFVTDAANREVLEYDGTSGQIQRWYAYGLGPNEVLNQMNVALRTRETFIPDIQGSVLATLDSASGALAKAGYLAYGENPSATGGTFRYTGQRIDPETAGSAAQPSGLYYYRVRMYSPTLGRFLQVDPAGFTNGINLYAYVGNDPLNRTDPTGRDWSSISSSFALNASQYGLNTAATIASGQVQVAQAAMGLCVLGPVGCGVGAGITAGQVILGGAVAAGAGALILYNEGGPTSPQINPQDLAGKTPAEIDQAARAAGLIPKGPSPQTGQGSYVDPVTGEQRVLIHPDDSHMHVNNPAGERLDINGQVVPPESPEAHLPLGQ